MSISLNTITPVVILSFGRTGSNFFISKLIQSRQLLIAWEPFNTKINNSFEFNNFPNISWTTRAALEDVALRAQDPESYLERLVSAQGLSRKDHGLAALVFKLFPMHSIDMYFRAARDPRTKCIFLTRHNQIAHYASFVISRITNQYVSAGGEFNNSIKIPFDPISFEIFCHLQDVLYFQTLDSLKEKPVNTMVLDYDTITSDIYDFGPVLKFCGCDVVPLGPSWLHRQGQRLQDTFTNYESVVSYCEHERRDLLPFLQE